MSAGNILEYVRQHFCSALYSFYSNKFGCLKYPVSVVCKLTWIDIFLCNTKMIFSMQLFLFPLFRLKGDSKKLN